MYATRAAGALRPFLEWNSPPRQLSITRPGSTCEEGTPGRVPLPSYRERLRVLGKGNVNDRVVAGVVKKFGRHRLLIDRAARGDDSVIGSGPILAHHAPEVSACYSRTVLVHCHCSPSGAAPRPAKVSVRESAREGKNVKAAVEDLELEPLSTVRGESSLLDIFNLFLHRFTLPIYHRSIAADWGEDD